jgi:hypothetical protein
MPWLSVIVVLAIAALPVPAAAQPVADFYRASRSRF